MAHDPNCPCCRVQPDHLCKDCGGTGHDKAKTEAARKSGQLDNYSHISCWSCNGNGMDPAAFFNWCESLR